MRYMSVELIWNLSQQIYLETLSLKHANEVPKLPGIDYVAKNWALAMTLKALPLVHFWSTLLLKEQNNDDLCLKNVKKAGLISQSISSEFSLKITTKLVVFFQLFLGEVCPENYREIGRFFWEFVPKNPTKFDFFSATYQKPCIEWHDPSDLKISTIEVGINLEVNWLCLCDLAHFLWWKQSKIIWNVCFNFSLLI